MFIRAMAWHGRRCDAMPVSCRWNIALELKPFADLFGFSRFQRYFLMITTQVKWSSENSTLFCCQHYHFGIDGIAVSYYYCNFPSKLS